MSSFRNLIQARKDFFWLIKKFKKDVLAKNKRAIEMRKKSQAMIFEFLKIQKENKLKSKKKVNKKLVNTILDGYEMLNLLGMKTINDNK